MDNRKAFDTIVHIDLARFTEEEQEALITAAKALKIVYCKDCWKRFSWYCPSYMKQTPGRECTCGDEKVV